ncbi:MAG: hypothetical protein HKN11_07735 [Rhizobiales bacterium]|nr:hypothetical protein [Hyphomicrobiales bacterium]
MALASFDSLIGTSKKRSDEWWRAQIVAANLERKLGLFEQGRTRIGNLEFDGMEANSAIPMYAKQTPDWIEKRNSEPQNFLPNQSWGYGLHGVPRLGQDLLLFAPPAQAFCLLVRPLITDSFRGPLQTTKPGRWAGLLIGCGGRI